jgi:hypothetical protein
MGFFDAFLYVLTGPLAGLLSGHIGIGGGTIMEISHVNDEY